jgi:hypothetical protein
MHTLLQEVKEVGESDDDDDDVYLNKLHTRGVIKSVLYV